MAVSTINGSRYFLTIVDDFSRPTWIYLMYSESQAAHILQAFYAMINTQFNTKIKCIRTNNGAEF